MGLKDIWTNAMFWTDTYNLDHINHKKNVDYEVSAITNRAKPMILYGFNELAIHVLDRKIEVDQVEQANENAKSKDLYFPFDMWYKVATEFGGRIPLQVQALPDGTWCPKGTPVVQIKNTEEGMGELVTWFEGILMKFFFASGCATEAFWMRRYLEKHKMNKLRFHSFAYRSYPTQEGAYWGGTAWNLFLFGTDDFHTYLHTPNAEIGSISAGAHKTIQQFDDEREAYTTAIDAAMKFKNKIVAFPIDTYDAWKMIDKYIYNVLDYAKDRGVHVVFRPDSGDVFEQALAINRHYNNWDNWSVIIGEDMSRLNVIKMDEKCKQFGFPIEKMSYGIGGGFHKHIDRDWLGFAMKTSYSNGAPRMKVVKTDPFKQSIPDVVNLVYDDDGKMMIEYTRDGDEHGNGLYYDVYHYDERSSRPKTTRMTWDEIQTIAVKNLEVKYPQIGIKLSPIVKSKIEEFKARYI